MKEEKDYYIWIQAILDQLRIIELELIDINKNLIRLREDKKW